MLEENKKITLTGEEAITILSEVEYILISLRNIARYYCHKESGEITDSEKNKYYKETTNFIDENNITHRLALIRRVVSEKFEDELGDDDMDDIERELEKLRCWTKPGD